MRLPHLWRFSLYVSRNCRVHAMWAFNSPEMLQSTYKIVHNFSSTLLILQIVSMSYLFKSSYQHGSLLPITRRRSTQTADAGSLRQLADGDIMVSLVL